MLDVDNPVLSDLALANGGLWGCDCCVRPLVCMLCLGVVGLERCDCESVAWEGCDIVDLIPVC